VHHRTGPILIAVACLVVAGCQKFEPAGQGSTARGRYQGIGIATPGERWSKLADAPKPASGKAADLNDDDYVVFVTDSSTGEIRECGNRSGFCVSIHPWDRTAPKAPLSLTAHAHAQDDVTNLDDTAEENTAEAQ